MGHEHAQREKNRAALLSVLAAIGLTMLKLLVGVLTNSLGILAEAAHSALDLVAAGMTWFAVRWAGRPADYEHPFGHGKMESLSALFETVLLALTALWVIYEGLQRLLAEEVVVQVNIWSYLVVLTAIAVDYNRARMLKKAAEKYNSQALEADALHFSTDIWSSSVVFIGLIGVWLAGRFPPLAWMVHADAVAAIFVALIVIYVSGRMGTQTVRSLLDTAPQGMAEEIVALVKHFPGVRDCHAVRVRPSGPGWFIDMHVVMDAELPLGEAHRRADEIEQAVAAHFPGADVTVHTEPPDAVDR